MSVNGKKLFVPSGGGGSYTTDGLILDLNANDGSYSTSSTQWADASGSNYNFNRSGNVSWQQESATGVGSWYFNGGFFNFSPSGGSNNGQGHFDLSSFSIEAWFKFIPYGIQSTPWLWSYDYSSHTSPYYKQYLRIGNYANTSIGGYNSATGGTIAGNNWYQAVTTRTNSTLRGQMFINGQEVNIAGNASRVLQGSPYGYSQEAWIGKGNYGSGYQYYSSYYKGWMSIFRFYNKPLTNAEVAANYEFSKTAHGLT